MHPTVEPTNRPQANAINNFRMKQSSVKQISFASPALMGRNAKPSLVGTTHHARTK
jgi:hypothetical protein